jgi:hypothetical protein
MVLHRYVITAALAAIGLLLLGGTDPPRTHALPAGCTILVDSPADNTAVDTVVTLREGISFATDVFGPAAGELDEISSCPNDDDNPGAGRADLIVFSGTQNITLNASLPPLSTSDDHISGIFATAQVSGHLGAFDCFPITSGLNEITLLTIRNCSDAIQISGTAAGNTIGGSSAARNVIRDNATGVRISGENADANTVAANYIGTDATGAVAASNDTGVVVEGGADNNAIGGTDSALRNVISANSFHGVQITGAGSTGNVIQGNYIGTSAAGTAALGNGLDGVNVTGGATGNFIGKDPFDGGAGNVISGNGAHGVNITGDSTDSNTVQSNIIGLNANGNGAIANSGSGVAIDDADSNDIGGVGTTGGNTISGNTGNGVVITAGDFGATGTDVRGNDIGIGTSGQALGNGLSGVSIVSSSDNDVFSNTIKANHTEGVNIANAGSHGNVVRSNNIGRTSPTDAVSLGNGQSGVLIQGAPNNTIEGSIANVIGGNLRGVAIGGPGATGNAVFNNRIGTDFFGNSDLGNADEGVFIGGGASNNTIGGGGAATRNIISGNDSSGILIQSATTSGNTVAGNYIGTKGNGTEALPNAANGITLTAPGNTIGGGNGTTPGGPCTGACNLISGNSGDGMILAGADATGSVVQGNFVGTNAAGTSALPNSVNGIDLNGAPDNLIGGDTAAERNVISGNGLAGIGIFSAGSTGNRVEGNFIGTNAGGNAALAGQDEGVALTLNASSNTIGGSTAGTGNVISGNSANGVRLSASGNFIRGNYVGTNAVGTGALGNGLGGISLTMGAASNTIGGTSPGARNVISANAGPLSTSGGVMIANADAGNVVQGNYIGTDASGGADLGNSGSGVLVEASGATLIGGGTGAGNVISGNGYAGIALITTDAGNLVLGNLIGTNAAGTAAISNSLGGVLMFNSSNNFIGGNTPETRNVISGHTSGPKAAGVWLDIGGSGQSTGNLIQGNYIGTNATGSSPLPNLNGVLLEEAAGNTIGGDTSGERNVISGNNRGVYLSGVAASGNLVQGNYIGTNASGNSAVGNGTGVFFDGAGNNTVGGTAAGTGNVISGNTGGILIANGADLNLVQGNLIGTGPDGMSPLGNTGPGVRLFGTPPGTSNNSIGGGVTGAANVIAYNGGDGVIIDATSGPAVNNSVRRNSIFANGGLGIDLVPGFGMTANDTDDPDTGANNLQNFPILTLSSSGGGSTTITGSLNSTPSTLVTIDFFHTFACDSSGHGEGQTFLFQHLVTTSASGDVALSPTFPSEVPAGRFITATATSPTGNTSEASACVPSANDGDDDNDGYTDASEAGTPLCVSAGNDDAFDDAIVDDGCPGGPAQAGNFSEAQFKIGTGSLDPCGQTGWPSDVFSSGASANKLTIQDVISFVTMPRKLDKDPGDTGFNSRWDLAPGRGIFGKFININDITALVNGTTGSPPMFNGTRAFDKECPFPP